MEPWTMAIPLSVDAVGRTAEYWRIMREKLSAMGCNRVFLTILGRGAAAPVQHFREVSDKLVELGAFFREAGIEPAIWMGHTIGHAGTFAAADDCHPPVVCADAAGTLLPQPGCFCPLSKSFQHYMGEVLAALASSKLPMLMLDDDYRLGNHGGEFGCFCDLHMARFQERSGLSITAQELARKIRNDLALRRLWSENNRDSLYEFAEVMERFVHAVSPETRIGLATAAMLRCGDGVNVAKLVQIFNGGKTRPFLRTGGAPYWLRTPEHVGWTVEYSRLQHAWLRESGVEVFAEGDTFPHSTFFTAAASLEAFDEGLAASGFPGILSYQFCYGDPAMTDPAFERLTLEQRRFHRALREVSPPEWEEVGFELLASQEGFLARNAELTPWGTFFEGVPALRVLPRLGIACAFGNRAMPVVLAGEECAALSDAVLKEAFRRGAVLDAPAAEALLARGFDLGVQSLNRWERPPKNERFPNGVEATYLCGDVNTLWKCEGGDSARICSTFGENVPGVLHLEPHDGERLVLLPWSMERGGGLNFNFMRQQQWHEAFAFLHGSELPVRMSGKADLRTHIRRSPETGELAVTLQNLSLDAVDLGRLKLEISPEYQIAAWLRPHDESAKEWHGALSTCILQPMQMSVIRLKRRVPVAANGK